MAKRLAVKITDTLLVPIDCLIKTSNFTILEIKPQIPLSKTKNYVKFIEEDDDISF